MRFYHGAVVGEIDNLPGCSQIAVFHSVFTRKDVVKGKGMGKYAHFQRIQEARLLGYDSAICTVDASNSVQLAILAKNGWKEVHEFLSSKTGHTVKLFVRSL